MPGSRTVTPSTRVVYVSSTLQDLQAERTAVIETIREAEWVVRHSYRANERSLRTACLEDVASSDLYIAVIGLRYGYVISNGKVNPAGKSITELEFEAARAAEIPTYVFVKSDSARYLPSYMDSHTKENQAGHKIAQFRARLMSGDECVVDIFEDATSLRLKCAQLIGRLREEYAAQKPSARQKRRVSGSPRPPRAGTSPTTAERVSGSPISTPLDGSVRNVWSLALTDLPQGPMVRDIAVRELSDALAEKFADEDLKSIVASINEALREAAQHKNETPERLALGRIPRLSEGASRFFSALLHSAALNGPRALLATLRALRVDQLKPLASREVEYLEQAILRRSS